MVGFQGMGIEIKRRRYVLDFALLMAAAAIGFHGQIVRLFLLLLMVNRDAGVHLAAEELRSVRPSAFD